MSPQRSNRARLIEGRLRCLERLPPERVTARAILRKRVPISPPSGDVAALLGLGGDQAGQDAGGLVLALFNGVLFQALLDPALASEGARMVRAQARLRTVLPAWPY